MKVGEDVLEVVSDECFTMNDSLDDEDVSWVKLKDISLGEVRMSGVVVAVVMDWFSIDVRVACGQACKKWNK